MAIAEAKRRVGERGWRILSPEMREAFVAREVVSLILSQIDANLENEPGLRHYRDTARAMFAMLEEND